MVLGNWVYWVYKVHLGIMPGTAPISHELKEQPDQMVKKPLQRLSALSVVESKPQFAYLHSMQKFLTLTFLSLSLSLSAQDLNSASFDFWLGEWKLKWVNAQGDTIEGANHVERILAGKVIQENFFSPTGFEGKSWSVYSPSGEWKQTWVDNGGGYLEFTGAQSGDSLIFEMEPAMINEKPTIRRMVFFNIKPDSFTWRWQSALAGSQKWQTKWEIFYER